MPWHARFVCANNTAEFYLIALTPSMDMLTHTSAHTTHAACMRAHSQQSPNATIICACGWIGARRRRELCGSLWDISETPRAGLTTTTQSPNIVKTACRSRCERNIQKYIQDKYIQAHAISDTYSAGALFSSDYLFAFILLEEKVSHRWSPGWPPYNGLHSLYTKEATRCINDATAAMRTKLK